MRPRIRWFTAAGIGIVLVFCFYLGARFHGADAGREHRWVGAGVVKVPRSSIERPGDVGVRGHTNLEIFVPDRPVSPQPPPKEFYSNEGQVPPAKSGGASGEPR